MKPEKILLPVDVNRCPVEVFELVNGFAKRPEVTVILLHVVHLNIAAPANRIYADLGREAQCYLERLAGKHVHPIATAVAHVRTGAPAEEILAEAKAESVDLIILPTYGPSFLNRLRGLWKPASQPVASRLVERLIREAQCGVFVVMAKTRFNCEKAWGRPEKGSDTPAQAAAPSVSSGYRPGGLKWLPLLAPRRKAAGME